MTSSYVTDVAEQAETLPAWSAAVAKNSVLELSGTETWIPGELNAAAVPVAIGVPEQSMLV